MGLADVELGGEGCKGAEIRRSDGVLSTFRGLLDTAATVIEAAEFEALSETIEAEEDGIRLEFN